MGTCISLILLTPDLTSSLEGIVLSILIGAALMLSTRSIRSRVEVGVVSGIVILVGASLLHSVSTTAFIIAHRLCPAALRVRTNVVTPKGAAMASRTTASESHHHRDPPFALYIWECNGS